MTDLAQLADGVLAGERRALARAITLVESARADHRAAARTLLGLTGRHGRQSLRIGLSGAPGVGKSTFVEAFGTLLTAQGLRVAVLAVDPSSARSGGSILGDKTRMERLAREPRAYIRPSPSAAELGGVARRTREAVALCEAAGFDVIVVETVGVGQSETLVAGMTDVFVLLIAPGGGDELQGVKRGIIELSDLVVVNKADGALKPAALRTCGDYAAALRLLRGRPEDPPGYPRAMTASALEAEGIAEVWSAVCELADFRRAAGHLAARRAEQARDWFEDEVRRGLIDRLGRDSGLAARMAALEDAVMRGEIAPGAAAEEILAALGDPPR